MVYDFHGAMHRPNSLEIHKMRSEIAPSRLSQNYRQAYSKHLQGFRANPEMSLFTIAWKATRGNVSATAARGGIGTVEKNVQIFLTIRILKYAFPQMRRLILSLCLFLMGSCLTLQQGKVGYVVPGGEFRGKETQYKACGSIGMWMFVLDERLIESVLNKAETDQLTTGTRQLKVNLDIPSSCYVLKVFEEGK